MIKSIIRCLLAIVLLSSTSVAQTRANCASRDDVVKHLANTFGESRQSVGLGSNNVMVEVFASQTSGSWTIVITSPTGLTCLVASGQAFEAVAEVLPIDGDDT